MADKPKREDTPLAAAVRKAAEREGSLEKLRKKTKLSTGTFYGILGGAKAQANPSIETLRALSDAGVKVPRSLLSFLSAA